MNRKLKWKIVVDAAMTVLLLLLMAFELVGSAVHEWIGLGMFVLFIVHHVLNWRWSRNLLKGKYTPFRILQTVLVFAVLVSMLSAMISAVIISREVFAFLPISGGRSFGRTLHMLAAYWGFVFLSLHLGLHWSIMTGMAGKLCKKQSRIRAWILRIAAAGIAVYGAFAFVTRQIPGYMFLRSQFVFFDFEEPLVFFFLDYLAVMGLFVWIGHYLAKALLCCIKKGRKEGRAQ